MQIIGAGFGRTGTLSLKQALEILGYSCYHMEDMIRRPGDMKVWTAAAKGEAVHWPDVFDGYQATVDFPGSLFYRELLVSYPDAKVILTVRDREKWYDSMYRTAYTMMELNTPSWVRTYVPPYKRFADLIDLLIWKGLFDGRFAEREHAIAIYEQHIEEVKRNVPADKLLVYNVKEGWEPLCTFLGVPIPANTSFPYVNDNEMVQRQMKTARMMYTAIPIAILLIVGALIWLAWWTITGNF